MRKELYNRIYQLLIVKPAYRDDDNLLCCRVWHECLPDKSISAFEFLEFYRDNKLPKADTISRFRRLIENKHPELRGKEWERRQKKVIKVKQDLKGMTP